MLLKGSRDGITFTKINNEQELDVMFKELLFEPTIFLKVAKGKY
jgi:hypothetical protein